jgi:hypothetical protein
MITQHEFVAECLRYYAENYYEPGNPEDGKWDIAHYPTPKCKGGTETILLLREHHAIQGLLQSEEFNHPCIGFWEQAYLPDDYLPLLEKWRTVMRVLRVEGQWGNTTKEERREKCKKSQEAMCKARRKRIEIVINNSRYEYESIAAASADLGVPAQTISHRLKYPNGKGEGKRRHHFKKARNNFTARYL